MQAAVKSAQEMVELNMTFEELYPLAVTICEDLLKHSKIIYDGKYMCPGLIAAYGRPVSRLEIRDSSSFVRISCPSQIWLGCAVLAKAHL